MLPEPIDPGGGLVAEVVLVEVATQEEERYFATLGIDYRFVSPAVSIASRPSYSQGSPRKTSSSG